MQRAHKKPASKRAIFEAVVLFLCSYLIFLILWIQIKDRYGYIVSLIASELVSVVKDVRFEEIKEERGIVQATFSPGRMSNLLLDVRVKVNSFTFNVPLTFGIMVALFPFVRRRWSAYGQALLILFGVHLLYVFSLEANSLTTTLIQRGLETVSKSVLLFYQFLWEFTNNMVIRFEPFLIGFYVFIRFRE
jgi:hypothetical protein